jgi:hypothetical protein
MHTRAKLGDDDEWLEEIHKWWNHILSWCVVYEKRLF